MMRMRTRAAVQVGNQLKDQLCLTLDVNLTADTRLWYIFCELFVSCIIFWNDSIADESCRDCDRQRMCTWHTVQAKPGSRSRSESAKRQISTFILSKLKLSKLQAMRVHWLCKWNLWKGRFWLLREAKYNIMTKGGLQFRHPCLLWTYRTVGAFVLLMSRWIPRACPDQTQAYKSICMLHTSDLCFPKEEFKHLESRTQQALTLLVCNVLYFPPSLHSLHLTSQRLLQFCCSQKQMLDKINWQKVGIFVLSYFVVVFCFHSFKIQFELLQEKF